MRKTDLFKKFYACVIMRDRNDTDAIRVLLRKMGIRIYSSYRDFKDVLFQFDKFYSAKFPDFVLCEWDDDAFNNIDIMEIYQRSDFSQVPLLILTNDNQSELEVKAKELKLVVSSFIAKPIYLKPLQTAAIKALSGKFQVRSSQQNN